MYNEHFGLKRAPFRITPDTRLFYSGGSRGDILEALVYAVTSGEGIVKVVGEVGSGKTMLCRMLEERLPDSVEVVYLANPSLSPEDTLHAIALEMDLPLDPDANRLKVMHVLQEHLLEKHTSNRQVVVFVEEAQSMPIATLEEIRLLSNLETKRDKLLQIVLFGQPELDENLDEVAIRQLKERITHSFYLKPFTSDQIREYVNFRLRAVGYRGPDMFRAGAYRLMAHASAGLTRRVNILADKALLAAFADDSHEVTGHHVATAIKDSQFSERRRWRLPEISVAFGVLLIVLAVAWSLGIRNSRPLEYLSSLIAAEPAAPGGAVTAAQRGAQGQAPAADAASMTTRQAPGAAPQVAASAGDGSGAETRASEAAVLPAASRAVRVGEGRRGLTVATDDGRGRLLLSDSLSLAAAPAAPVAGAPEPKAMTASAVPSPAPAEPAPVVAEIATRSAATETPAVDSPPGDDGIEMVTATDIGPLTKARLAATRDWLQEANGAHFSIQLLLTDFPRRANLERFLREREAAGEIADYFVYETRIRRRTWYGVLYREYDSFGAAKAALAQLPDTFRRHQPFIRNVRDIATLDDAPGPASATSRDSSVQGATGT